MLSGNAETDDSCFDDIDQWILELDLLEQEPLESPSVVSDTTPMSSAQPVINFYSPEKRKSPLVCRKQGISSKALDSRENTHGSAFLPGVPSPITTVHVTTVTKMTPHSVQLRDPNPVPAFDVLVNYANSQTSERSSPEAFRILATSDEEMKRFLTDYETAIPENINQQLDPNLENHHPIVNDDPVLTARNMNHHQLLATKYRQQAQDKMKLLETHKHCLRIQCENFGVSREEVLKTVERIQGKYKDWRSRPECVTSTPVFWEIDVVLDSAIENTCDDFICIMMTCCYYAQVCSSFTNAKHDATMCGPRGTVGRNEMELLVTVFFFFQKIHKRIHRFINMKSSKTLTCFALVASFVALTHALPVPTYSPTADEDRFSINSGSDPYATEQRIWEQEKAKNVGLKRKLEAAFSDLQVPSSPAKVQFALEALNSDSRTPPGPFTGQPLKMDESVFGLAGPEISDPDQFMEPLEPASGGLPASGPSVSLFRNPFIPGYPYHVSEASKAKLLNQDESSFGYEQPPLVAAQPSEGNVADLFWTPQDASSLDDILETGSLTDYQSDKLGSSDESDENDGNEDPENDLLRGFSVTDPVDTYLTIPQTQEEYNKRRTIVDALARYMETETISPSDMTPEQRRIHQAFLDFNTEDLN